MSQGHSKGSNIRENLFSCGCSTNDAYFSEWLRKDQTILVTGYRQLRCQGKDNQKVYLYNRDEFNCDWLIPTVAILSTIACISLTLLIALPCYKYRWYIMHNKIIWRTFLNQLKRVKFDLNCQYDAFVSYNTGSNSDTEFVVNCLLPALESKKQKVSNNK